MQACEKRWLSLLLVACMCLAMLPMRAEAAEHADAPTIRWWLSDTEYGDTVPQCIAGNTYYFCYRLYDRITGKDWDAVTDSSYGVQLTLYRPDGSVLYTNRVLFEDDHGWIACVFDTPGTYKRGVDVSGNYIYSGTQPIDVKASSKEIHASTTAVNLTLGAADTQTVQLWSSGDYSVDTSLFYQANNDNISCAMGEQTADGSLPLTITAKAPGMTLLTVGVKDAVEGVVLHSMTIPVRVNVKTYTVSFDANGGRMAPARQTKYHDTALTLSSAQPIRGNYTFLGWSADPTATDADYQPGGSYTGNGDVTLYALWRLVCQGGQHTCHYAVTKAPTASENGTLTGTCTRCKGTFPQTLPKLNTTDYTCTVKTPGTCMANGLKTYTWKTTTYGSFSFDVTISATGHEYDSGTVTTAATCTKEGIRTFVCARCGDTYTRAIALRGHTYRQGACSVCGVTDPAYIGVNGPVEFDGIWYQFSDGKMVSTFTGLHKVDGVWYYFREGVVATDVTNLIKWGGEWWYVVKGRVASEITDLIKWGGEWWYVVKGKIASNTTTLVKWNGAWYYIYKGKLAGNTTNLIKYNGEWWYVVKGKIASNTTTLIDYNGGRYYIYKGKLAAQTTTLVKYEGNWYYVRNGKVDWSYTGTFVYSGKTYKIQKGRVV